MVSLSLLLSIHRLIFFECELTYYYVKKDVNTLRTPSLFYHSIISASLPSPQSSASSEVNDWMDGSHVIFLRIAGEMISMELLCV